MKKRALLSLTSAAGIVPLGFVAAHFASAAPHVPAITQTLPSTSAATPALPISVGAPAVVDAADAFLAMLTQQQRAVAQTGLTPQNAARWSNFPAAVVPRNGVYFRDLNAAQTAAALKVARLALSPEGFNRFQEVRATDDAFARSDEARRGPAGADLAAQVDRLLVSLAAHHPAGQAVFVPNRAALEDPVALAVRRISSVTATTSLHFWASLQRTRPGSSSSVDITSLLTFTTGEPSALQPPILSEHSRTSGRMRMARHTPRLHRCVMPCMVSRIPSRRMN